jgi:hypothetical protein
MSHLLKAIAKTHRPHLAAKMTAENGYDADKHRFAADLAKDGILTKAEAEDLDGCVDDLATDGHDGAALYKAAQSGEVDSSKLNDDELIAQLMEIMNEPDGADEPADSDENVTA